MIDILSIKFFDDDFNQIDANNLVANVGCYCRAEIEAYVHWEVLGITVSVDGSQNRINWDSGDFFGAGFQIGDTINLENFDVGGNNGDATILQISKESIHVDKSLTSTATDIVNIYGITPQTKLDYYFGLPENGDAETYLTKLDDNSEQRYSAAPVDHTDSNPVILQPFSGKKHWVTGNIAEQQATAVSGEGFGTTNISTGREQVFKINHIFYIPTYLQRQFNGGVLTKDLVEYFNDTFSPKYVLKIETSGDGQITKQTTDDGNVIDFLFNGNCGWFGENKNGGAARFTLSQTRYIDIASGAEISGLNINGDTRIEMDITAINGGQFVNTPLDNNCAVQFQRVVPRTTYRDPLKTYNENTFFDRSVIKQGATNEDGVYLKNGVFQFNSSTSVTIKVDFKKQDFQEEGQEYLIWPEIQSTQYDDLRQTDKMALLIQGQMLDFIDLTGILEEEIRVNEHPFNIPDAGFTDYKGWVNDDLVVHDSIIVQKFNAAGQICVLQNTQLSVEVENDVTGQRFTLEEYTALNIGDTIDTGHNLIAADEKNVGKLVENPLTSDANQNGYLFQYGIKARFEEWLFQANAIIGNGNTKKWSNFNGIDGWQMYIVVNNELSIGGNNVSNRHRSKLYVIDYEEFDDCEVFGEITTEGETTGIDYGGKLAATEDTIVTATFTGDGLDCHDFDTTDFWGVLHWYYGGEDTIYSENEISSIFPPKPSNGWIGLVGGLTEVVKSAAPNTVTLRAVLETTGLDQEKTNYTLEGRLGKITFPVPVGFPLVQCDYSMPDADGFYTEGLVTPIQFQATKLNFYDKTGASVVKTDVLPLLTTDTFTVDISTIVYNGSGYEMNFLNAFADFLNQNASTEALFSSFVFSREDDNLFIMKYSSGYGFEIVLDRLHAPNENTFNSQEFGFQNLINGSELDGYTPNNCGTPQCISFVMPHTNQFIIDNDGVDIDYFMTFLSINGNDVTGDISNENFSIPSGARTIDGSGCEQDFASVLKAYLTNESAVIGIDDFYNFNVVKDSSLSGSSCDQFTVIFPQTTSFEMHIRRLDTGDTYEYSWDADTMAADFETDGENPCGCPDGFDLNADGVCEKVTSVDATYNGVDFLVAAGATNSEYGKYGANFYDNITNKPFPLKEVSNTIKYDDNSDVLLIENIQNALWGQDDSTVNGRLNAVGVWKDGETDPFNEWIGFSACFNLDEGKTYSIGLAADNMCRFTIDGIRIAEFETGAQYTFRYWKIFEIDLDAGTHIIEMEGLNNAAVAAFGAEVYDATVNELRVITDVPTLETKVLFSTGDEVGQNFDLGETGAYSCPDGYALDLCDGPPKCSIYQQSDPITCIGLGCDTVDSVFIQDCSSTFIPNNGDGIEQINSSAVYSDSGLNVNTGSGNFSIKLTDQSNPATIFFDIKFQIGQNINTATALAFNSTEGFTEAQIKDYLEGMPFQNPNWKFYRERFAKENGYIDDGNTDNTVDFRFEFEYNETGYNSGDCLNDLSSEVVIGEQGILYLSAISLSATAGDDDEYEMGVISTNPQPLDTFFEHTGASYGTDTSSDDFESGDSSTSASNTSSLITAIGASDRNIFARMTSEESGSNTLQASGVLQSYFDFNLVGDDTVNGSMSAATTVNVAANSLGLEHYINFNAATPGIDTDIESIDVRAGRGAGVTIETDAVGQQFYTITFPNGLILNDSITGLTGNLSYSSSSLVFHASEGAGVYTIFFEPENASGDRFPSFAQYEIVKI